MDLASVNYLHYGANKSWYCIPPAHRSRFEQLVKDLLPELFRQCPEFFRHKELLVSPYVLESYNIPVVRMVQRPGEFVINVPGELVLRAHPAHMHCRTCRSRDMACPSALAKKLASQLLLACCLMRISMR